MRRSAFVALVVAGVAVAVLGAWLLFQRSGEDAATGPVAVDYPLPVLSGESLDGKAVTTDQLKGHVTVINVWASWCGPCAEELPAMVRVARSYGASDGVRFLGIDYRDDRAQAAHWQDERYGMPYPSLYDPKGQFASDLKFPYVPDTYVVDASGTVRWKIIGQTDEAELSGLLDQVLAETPTSPSA